ncbi:MAG: flavodoxin family protein [Bacteroidales bacterium]|nr:flavodoxin family protein [Bacteroidales bacterium]
MKITAFVGSARKKHSYQAAENFLKHLQSLGDVEYEVVALSEYNLKLCRGCKLCLDKGEELCPLRDDRDLLLNKITQSDGILLASPNYSFQVSGVMKVFLDRFAYLFHRPRYFGKTCTSIVAQGVYGGHKIVKYLDFVGNALGFKVVRGLVIKTLEPMTEEARQKTDRAIKKQAGKYYAKLKKQEYPKPSLFRLMLYRMSRNSMKMMLDENFRDYTYFTEQGRFESDYYYPVNLDIFRRAMGRLFDFAARKMAVRSSPES